MLQPSNSIDRVDAILVGGIREPEAVRALCTAHLAEQGAVLDGNEAAILNDQTRYAEAFELYKRCRRRVPEYRPAPNEAAKIGEYAATIGQAGIAIELGYNPEAQRALGTGSKP